MQDEYKTKYEILKRAKEAKNIPFKEYDINNRLGKGKGGFGVVMEEGHFGYTINSRPEADFKEANVELKVTPFKRGERKISAKERLVLGIIDYMEEYKRIFETSKFWSKNQSLLIMFYEYIKDVPNGDLSVYEAILYEYPEEDLVIIKDDWHKIMSKIKAGKAHEISEGDTMYLGACTKGATRATSMVRQPFSDELARRRAYSLKQSYMTYIFNEYVIGDNQSERIITNPDLLKDNSFEDYIISVTSKYYGKTQVELCKLFNIEDAVKSKDVNERLLAHMFGLKSKLGRSQEFQKASIVPKTIRLSQDGKRIKESMSFPTFKFLELIEETWEESTLRNTLSQTKFMFVIFQFDDEKQLRFKRIKFWNIPNDDLEEVRKVWQRTVNTIKEGVVLKKTKRGITNNLPKKTESRVAHVRPHGRNAQDTYPLPDGREMTKQCFWLNNSYILEQIIDK